MSNGNNKLFIIRGKPQGKRVTFDPYDRGSVIEICFNPTDYSVDKKNSFSEANIPGLGSPIIQFNHGNNQTLSLELLLDTYRHRRHEDLRDKYIRPLEKLINIDGDLHAPPPCKVTWGSLNFVGLVESFSKKYLLFLEDGTPVRAQVNLSFKEYKPVDIQVRETAFSSPDKIKTRLVKEGETIWQLADIAYGDPGLWRIIAQANDIEYPRDLPVGKEIIIPVLEQ